MRERTGRETRGEKARIKESRDLSGNRLLSAVSDATEGTFVYPEG